MHVNDGVEVLHLNNSEQNVVVERGMALNVPQALPVIQLIWSEMPS